MTDRHLQRRPPAASRRFTWSRIPMGDSGWVCYRLFKRDRTGAQHMAIADFSRGTTRHRIAETVWAKRHNLIASVKELEPIL